VVSAVESRPTNIMSSHPTTAISSGTFEPNPAQALEGFDGDGEHVHPLRRTILI
jgi:hypothetical protein